MPAKLRARVTRLPAKPEPSCLSVAFRHAQTLTVDMGCVSHDRVAGGMEPDEKGQAIIGLALVGALLSHLEQPRLADLAGEPFVDDLGAFQERLEEWLERDRDRVVPHLRLSKS